MKRCSMNQMKAAVFGAGIVRKRIGNFKLRKQFSTREVVETANNAVVFGGFGDPDEVLT
jgi:hypothetical protein